MPHSALPSSVAICGHSLQRNMLLDLIRHVRLSWGAKIHLFINGPTQQRFYGHLLDEGVVDSITFAEMRVTEADYASETSDDAVAAEAGRWEEYLGLTYNLLAVCDRHLGRGFQLAGPNHPRSRLSERPDYMTFLRTYNRRIAFWERELSGKQIELVLNPGRELVAVANRLGVPVRRMMRARTGNHYYWAYDEKYYTPAVEEAYRRLPEDLDVELPAAPPASYVSGRDWFLDRNDRFWKLCRNVLRQAANHVYWRLTKSEKAEGYYLSSEARSLARTWWALRDQLSGRYASLSTLEGKTFFFYPLQTEPELSLQAQSPEYFFQLETIARLVRDMPAGVFLAVKETYFAVGRRPSEFYSQIRDFKNVVFLDISEPGMECIRRAAATITITSTAGHEAAVLGHQVVSFGRHNLFNFLPHVNVVDETTDLRALLRRLVVGPFDTERAARDGKRFQQAILDASFDMDDYNHARAGKAGPEAIARAVEALAHSLTAVSSGTGQGEGLTAASVPGNLSSR